MLDTDRETLYPLFTEIMDDSVLAGAKEERKNIEVTFFTQLKTFFLKMRL
jgi:hypothetical protein